MESDSNEMEIQLDNGFKNNNEQEDLQKTFTAELCTHLCMKLCFEI